MLLWSILLILAGSVFAGPIFRSAGSRTGWLLAAVPAALFLLFLLETGSVMVGDYPVVGIDWIRSLNVGLDMRLDGLSLLFALMITGVGAFILVYAEGYMGKHPMKGRFFSFLMLFMASMLGLTLSDNIILLFVFWELTSISSYLLIGFNHEDKSARWKALQALLVTGAGGMALLAGLLLLGAAGGTYSLSGLVSQGTALAETELGRIALPLILLGAFTKSAQFPFHFWLPNAMAGPTPVSAYLHSATMVKAGVYLLFRLHPVYGASDLWIQALVLCGSITLLYGAVLGLFQRDIKRILAFTTMAVLGLLVMLIGLGGELALKSAILFMLGHALYKSTLFMTAGNVDHETGTRDARLLGGLRRAMPLTALAAGLAAFSKAGFPPLLGFISKEYVYKASSALEASAPLLTVVALCGNAMLLALALKVGLHPYWSRVPERAEGRPWSRFLPRSPHEAPVSMILGPLFLATLGLVLGLFPGFWSAAIVEPSLAAAYGAPVEVKVALWHGFNLPLLLSILTVALGLGIYMVRQRTWRKQSISEKIARRDPERLYDFSFAQFVDKSKFVTRLLQNGSLRFYLWVILAAAGLLIGYKLLYLGGVEASWDPANVGFFEVVLCLSMLAAAAFTAFAPSLLHALAGLGWIGFSIALIFAYHGAPDLAITQIIVETLTVALLLFAARSLPKFRNYTPRGKRTADIVLSGIAGVLIAALALKANALQLFPTISSQLADWSYVAAKGKNVVNVILVDFRALDTFGEIIVLGIAAIGASLCLSSGMGKSGRQYGVSPILCTGAALLLPIFVVLSLAVLYRGHNEPGGGFIGGLLAAVGYLLYSLAHGPEAAERKLLVSPAMMIGVGLLVALLSGLFGVATGAPFMTGGWLPTFSLPLLGAVHLGTPLIFDVGVYLVVWGFSLQTAFALQAHANPETAR